MNQRNPEEKAKIQSVPRVGALRGDADRFLNPKDSFTNTKPSSVTPHNRERRVDEPALKCTVTVAHDAPQ